MWDVTSLADGFVAVGVRWRVNPAVPPAPDGLPRITVEAVLWRSADGITWETFPDDPAFALGSTAGTLSAGLSGVAVRDGRIVVVGATEADGALLWLGTPAATPAP